MEEEKDVGLGSIGTGEVDKVEANSISPCPHIDESTVLREDMVVRENDVYPYTVADGSTCDTQEANIKCHPETALAVSTDAIKDGKDVDENILTVPKVDKSKDNSHNVVGNDIDQDGNAIEGIVSQKLQMMWI